MFHGKRRAAPGNPQIFPCLPPYNFAKHGLVRFHVSNWCALELSWNHDSGFGDSAQIPLFQGFVIDSNPIFMIL